MAEVSRTARVIQNAKVALFFYCINLVLQFFSRKIFLDYLGAELLGLSTTTQNLLQFLNLAESGIGAAVAFALYKPLSVGNRQEINDIVSIQGWFYRWVGFFAIFGGIILMFFFPLIFSKANVPLIYAYITFTTFLVSSLLGYFFNYKIIVLSADQKEYKITFETQGIKVIKVITQMILISQLSDGYLWWLFLECISELIISIRLHLLIKKEYPWLALNKSDGYKLSHKYPFVLRKTRQVFFQKIAFFVNTQTTPLIIYAYSTLSLVAIYGNYFIIMSSCLLLVDTLSRATNAGVGNLVALEKREYVETVFWKILTLKLFVSVLICTSIYILSTPFVDLWLGEEYLMNDLSVGIMTLIFFIRMSRTSHIFLYAYGLFRDVWAQAIEVTLNLSLSIILGSFFGLVGVLVGVLLSQLFITNSWKPYFLFKYGFRQSPFNYIVKYTKKVLILFTTSAVTIIIFNYCCKFKIQNFLDWSFVASSVVVVYVCIATIILCFCDQEFRALLKQFLSTVKKK